ncbi:MAG: hypothetical protein HYX76_02300 [Acidobacteria bacterium]|nr:hypothetical protein [Acidobacteriota bacterium]
MIPFPGMLSRALAAAATGLLFVPSGSVANTASRALCAKGFEFAYNLDYDEAIATFRKAIVADPKDPAPYRAIAAITWLDITIFDRGSATIDDYVSNISYPSVKLPPPRAAQGKLFRENLDRALALADERLRNNPRDVSAHYEVGAAVAVKVSYMAVVEGRLVGAFRAARRAYDEHEQVMALDPRRKDAEFIVGSYRYAVSVLSLPLRMMAYVAGFGGGRERGLGMIEEAAAFPGEAQTDAKFFLVLIYNRERRYDDALRVLSDLQRRYAKNRLLWLNAGATALRAGRAARADQILTEGLARFRSDHRRRAFGETALWYYKRGAARVALGQRDAAARDLHVALTAGGRDWVRGRTHLELGKLADLGGDRPRARGDYEKARRLCEMDSDPSGAAEAGRFLARPYGR